MYGGWPSGEDPLSPVIWEAFKPESEPRRAIRRDSFAQARTIRVVRKKGTKQIVRRASPDERPTRVEPAEDVLEKTAAIY